MRARRYVAGEQGCDDAEIFDAIAGLVEKSLIGTRLDDGEPQYRLLDTTRAYALEKLEEHDELDVISLRHAEYVAEQLESQKEMLWLCQGPKELRPIPTNSATFGRRWNGALVHTATTNRDETCGRFNAAVYGAVATDRMPGLGGTGDRPPGRSASKLPPRDGDLCIVAAGLDAYRRQRSTFERLFRGRSTLRSSGDLAYELRLLSGLFMYSHWTMDIRGATDIATRSKKLALKTRDPDDMALAESMLAASDHLPGNHLVAQQHCEAGPPPLWRPVRAFEPDNICFITRASCSSAWHVLCCTGACSTNRWTMRGSP